MKLTLQQAADQKLLSRSLLSELAQGGTPAARAAREAAGVLGLGEPSQTQVLALRGLAVEYLRDRGDFGALVAPPTTLVAPEQPTGIEGASTGQIFDRRFAVGRGASDFAVREARPEVEGLSTLRPSRLKLQDMGPSGGYGPWVYFRGSTDQAGREMSFWLDLRNAPESVVALAMGPGPGPLVSLDQREVDHLLAGVAQHVLSEPGVDADWGLVLQALEGGGAAAEASRVVEARLLEVGSRDELAQFVPDGVSLRPMGPHGEASPWMCLHGRTGNGRHDTLVAWVDLRPGSTQGQTLVLCGALGLELDPVGGERRAKLGAQLAAHLAAKPDADPDYRLALAALSGSEPIAQVAAAVEQLLRSAE